MHLDASCLLCALIASALVALFVTSCRDDKEIVSSEQIVVADTAAVYSRDIVGFYLLNEGNMGSNKATLDYFDYSSGIYSRNIYSSANPTMVQELGDVGNDIAIYGSKLYATINCSNFVEVMDATTAKHISTIEVPNCRYLAFSDGYGYVTSYAGPVQMNPSYEQIGYVAKFDTTSMQIVSTCNVGYQPDGIEVVGNKLYVANSGGYRAPNYETTVSVIDKATFTETKRINVAPNLHRLCADGHGHLWVSSRGDYLDVPSRLFCLDISTEQVIDTLDVPVSNFSLSGDSLYIIGTQFSYDTYETTVSYAIVDVHKRSVVSTHFITDGTDAKIKVPYGIAVNPQNHEIYVTDAKNYVSPGILYCFNADGTLKWSVGTGDIPAHITFNYSPCATR